jgi:hypothetical protein
VRVGTDSKTGDGDGRRTGFEHIAPRRPIVG